MEPVKPALRESLANLLAKIDLTHKMRITWISVRRELDDGAINRILVEAEAV